MKVSDRQATGEYREEYPARPPAIARNTQNEREFVLLDQGTGVIDFPTAPFGGARKGQPRDSISKEGKNTFLWVIGCARVPILIENYASSEVAKHTNLTGGTVAHSGGELWFKDDCFFYLSGSSGRYPPRSKRELERIVEIFVSCGYNVESLGWDDETNRAYRSLR